MKTFTLEEIWTLDRIVDVAVMLGMSPDERDMLTGIANKMRGLREIETKRETTMGAPTTVCPKCTYPECGCALAFSPADEVVALREEIKEAVAIVWELNGHEGAEGWSADLRTRLDIFLGKHP